MSDTSDTGVWDHAASQSPDQQPSFEEFDRSHSTVLPETPFPSGDKLLPGPEAPARAVGMLSGSDSELKIGDVIVRR